MGSVIMLLYMEDKREQDRVFKFHSYLEIVKSGVVSFFLSLAFFSKTGGVFWCFRNYSLTGQYHYLVNDKVLCN